MPLPQSLALQGGATLLVVLIVTPGTGGDATKKAAKAQALLNVISALQAIQAGNAAAGLAALATALSSADLDPGVGLLVQEIVSVAATQLTALLAVAGQTIAGQIDETIAANVLAAMATACQAYLPKA